MRTPTITLLCLLLVGTSFAADQLQFGVVYNLTFPPETDYLYFELQIPYNELDPPALRAAIFSYLPFETLNVSASFTNQFPNYTDNQYFGSNLDGNYLRGLMWVGNIPAQDITLYVSVARAVPSEQDYFGLNVEYPTNLISSQVDLRYETVVDIDPWQTKWLLVSFPEDDEQFMSGLRAEFCDEPQGEVTFSLIFPEAAGYNDGEVINPCGCDDFIVQDRTTNLISRYTDSSAQMFIMPSAVSSQPVYAGLFYAGPTESPSVDSVKAKCPERAWRRDVGSSGAPRLREDDDFSMRLSLWGQELFPSVRTKLTKPDKVNNDLIANVDDTPYCDYWASDNFTAYVSDYRYKAFDSACFLEKYADNFTVYNFQTLVGDESKDRVIVLEDFFAQAQSNLSYINIVHSNEDCGSFAYYNTEVPSDGWWWEVPPTKKEWTPTAIGLVVLFGFLAVVFFLSSVLLISRLREYTRYRKIAG